MKKIYNAPNTIVVKIQSHPLMQISANMDSGQSITSSSGFGARGGSGWDDDDYDDYDE